MNQHTIVLLITAFPAAAFAQPFSISSYTFDSGGVSSVQAGTFALGGTIGQPDAGLLTAGTFQAQGGFWNVDSAQVACYANCDGSTGSPLLTANDFQCFLNKFAGGDPYANCDGSTGVPALTANDFQCFLNKFAGGCS